MVLMFTVGVTSNQQATNSKNAFKFQESSESKLGSKIYIN